MLNTLTRGHCDVWLYTYFSVRISVLSDIFWTTNLHIVVPGVLQDSSREEVLLSCVRLKECLMKMSDISSTYDIPLCYGMDIITAL